MATEHQHFRYRLCFHCHVSFRGVYGGNMPTWVKVHLPMEIALDWWKEEGYCPYIVLKVLAVVAVVLADWQYCQKLVLLV